MPDLTQQQEAALDVLRWLGSDHRADRRQGRTTVLAIALIRQALAHPGSRFPIRELHEARDAHLARVILVLIHMDPALREHFRSSLLRSHPHPALLYEGTAMPHAAIWLPPGWHSSMLRRVQAVAELDQALVDTILQDLRSAPAPRDATPASLSGSREPERTPAPHPREATRHSVWERLENG